MARTITKKNSVGRKRLMALADYLSKRMDDPKWAKFFRMDHWVVNPKSDGAYIRKHGQPADGKPVVVNKSCGTSACLLGHAVNVPALAKDFRAEFREDRCGGHEVALLVRGQEVAIDALTDTADYFGISEERAGQIFGYEGEDRDIAAVGVHEAVANMRLVIARIDAHEGWTR